MAIKGQAYVKTTWAFQERPVTSSKLNSWDDRIEAALELVHFLLSQAWGGGNGVVRGATASDLAVAATATPGLSVEVQPGYAFISRLPYKLASAKQTTPVVPPTVASRIDLVQARLDSWDVSVKIGIESATPTAPTPDTDCIALAQLYLRPGMTSIKNTNDGTNGYVIDVRQFV
jgi:hypothetical protein